MNFASFSERYCLLDKSHFECERRYDKLALTECFKRWISGEQDKISGKLIVYFQMILDWSWKKTNDFFHDTAFMILSLWLEAQASMHSFIDIYILHLLMLTRVSSLINMVLGWNINWQILGCWHAHRLNQLISRHSEMQMISWNSFIYTTKKNNLLPLLRRGFKDFLVSS